MAGLPHLLMRKRPARRASPFKGAGFTNLARAAQPPELWPFWGGGDGLLELFHLGVVELDRGRAAEDRDRDLEAGPLLVDILDRAVERGEGAGGHLALLADRGGDLVLEARIGVNHVPAMSHLRKPQATS